MQAPTFTPISGWSAAFTVVWRIFLYSVGAIVLLMVFFTNFFAPYSPETIAGEYVFAPPQRLHIRAQTESGEHIQPFVFAYEVKRDPATLRKNVVQGETEKIYLRWFAPSATTAEGATTSRPRRLLAPESVEEPFHLMGTDRLGRDRLSQVLFATRGAVAYGLIDGILLVGAIFVLAALVVRVGGPLNRAARWLLGVLGSVPTLIWRLLLLLLLVRIWPPVDSFALAMARQPELLPATGTVAVVAVIVLLSTIALCSSRRLVGWLFIAAFWLWLLQPQSLPRQLLIGQSEGATIATLILGLPEQLLALALLALVVGPILFLVLYHMRLTTAAGMDGKPTAVWRKFVPPVLLVAALAILADLLLTTGGFSGWLSPHSFGMLQLDMTNLALLTEVPWLAASMVPPALLFGLLLFIVDQWLRRGTGETV